MTLLDIANLKSRNPIKSNGLANRSLYKTTTNNIVLESDQNRQLAKTTTKTLF